MARPRIQIPRPIARHAATAFWAIVLLLSATACISTSQPPLRIDYYTLNYPPPASAATTPLPVILRIDRFADPAADTGRRMIWTRGGVRLQEYPYRQWRAFPGNLVADFLARDLRQSGTFTAVLGPESLVSPTHVLEGSVDQFHEERVDGAWYAQLTVTITLVAPHIQDITRRIRFQKRYAIKIPEKAHTPGAGLAEAMSRAMAELSSRIGRDLHERLSPPPAG